MADHVVKKEIKKDDIKSCRVHIRVKQFSSPDRPLFICPCTTNGKKKNFLR
jgi:hypothetical protein